MKQPKKGLGIITVLFGLPALLAIVAILSIPDVRESTTDVWGGLSLNLVTINILLTVIVRGIGGIIGGIMLYKGMEKGYYICGVVWGYFLLTSLISLVVTLSSDVLETWGMFANIAVVKLLVMIVFSTLILVSLYKSFKINPEDNNKSKIIENIETADV